MRTFSRHLATVSEILFTFREVTSIRRPHSESHYVKSMIKFNNYKSDTFRSKGAH